MTLGGQYKIISELGAGGMGVVYQAVDTMLEREVAVKQLRSEFARRTDVAERFKKEARIQARLNHPNIAHLYAFLKEEDCFYIVMEFVTGAPLSRLVPLAWEPALALFGQILSSLEYAHSLGVLHRDLKPENIMVTRGGVVKVMDFGIAHLLGSSRQTREHSIVGTLEYVPPEQIRGKTIDQRSDIYSLGILLFEMISGRVPFSAAVEFDLLQQHLNSPAPRLSDIIEVPRFLDDVISRAMSKNPEERFGRCSEMLGALREFAPNAFTGPFVREPLADEVEHCAKRIGALQIAGEMEAAALALESALADYPNQPALAACQSSIARQRHSRTASAEHDLRVAYLRQVMYRARDLEAQGDLPGSRELIGQALERYPRVPALRIAAAYLRDRSAENN